jgi:hypothetical protein
MSRGTVWQILDIVRLLPATHTVVPEGPRLLHGIMPRPKRTRTLSHIPGCLSTPAFCCSLLPRNMLQGFQNNFPRTETASGGN